MIKIVWQLRRNPQLSHEEFGDYWWNVHVPLLKSLMPDLVHYVGCFAVPSSGPTLAGSDAIVELGFPTAEIMETTFQTAWTSPERLASSEHLLSLPPEWEAKVRVVDGAATGSAVASAPTDRAARPSALPAPDRFRAISRMRRNRGLTSEQFQDYVVEEHLPLVRDRLPGLRELHVGFPLDGQSVDVDAVLEYTFDDLDVLEAEMAASSFADDEFGRSSARAFDDAATAPFVVGVVEAL